MNLQLHRLECFLQKHHTGRVKTEKTVTGKIATFKFVFVDKHCWFEDFSGPADQNGCIYL